MKKVAVMQPYLFPYLGYFQLVNAVDEFVFLDDVTFIKGGYINRNSILMDGRAHRFALPVADISSFRTIRDHSYVDAPGKFLELLRHAYAKAPLFGPVFDLVRSVVLAPQRSVAAVNSRSVMECYGYLGLQRIFSFSSDLDPRSSSTGPDRVVRLCRDRQASTYINAAGGRGLYDPAWFAESGLALGFIESRFPEYRQKATAFVPSLSIIDVLMWNTSHQVVAMLDQFSVDYPDVKPPTES